MSPLAVALALVAPLLHGGQRQWFVPGVLAPGAPVLCAAGGRRVTVEIPPTGSAHFAWRHGLQANVSVRTNGAVEVDCNVAAAPPRIAASTRYLVSRNGLGLLRGPNTRARLERLYGPAAASTSACAVVHWPAIGLRATFAGCSPDAPLAGATVTGRRWSTLDGVHVGDSLARMLWQDVGATRVRGSWILGGVGVRRPPRLVALVGRAGTVTGFRIASR